MKIKIKKVTNNEDIKTWVSWLNDKIVTKFSEQRLKKHTIFSQKRFLEKKIKIQNYLKF